MNAQIKTRQTNPDSPERAGEGEGLYDVHALPLQGRDEVLQPDQNHARKARPLLKCSDCGKAAEELYVVRPEEEICEECLTPEDLIRYPDFARRLELVKEGKVAA